MAAPLLGEPPLASLDDGDRDLAATLQLVADTIVESMGFEVATINLVDELDARSMVVVAVSGPEDVRSVLLGRRQGVEGWSKLIEASEPWGKLRFLDHRTAPSDPSDIFTWVPDIPVSDDPDAWHPEDALFAPLTGADGQHIGMLSVDLPRDGKRPGLGTQHALEALAVTAALAIQHATLAQESRRGILRFQAVFDTSPVAIALLGVDRCFELVNDAYCRFLGRTREELIGQNPMTFTHPDDRALSAAASAAARQVVPSPRSAEEVRPIDKRYVLPDGSVVWGRLHLAALNRFDDSGVVVAQVEDITERRRAEQALLQQAHFDALTSLPNRAQSMARLTRALERDVIAGTMTVVFFCDLDRLKLVNDVHGHAVGDAYIQEVSRRIRASVRAEDTVGRLSGDEFVVVLEGVQTPTEALGLAGRVIDGVRQPLRLAGATFAPSLSLGIAYSAGRGTTADELLAQADSAMYRAKSEERGAWQVYDPTMRNSAVSQLELRNDVAAALTHEQFVLHYQPIVRLADEQPVSHEALLRWQHPRRGLLQPGQFLDVILDSEYESPVTDWVLQQACADAAHRPVGSRTVAVNVSSLQVCRRDLPDVVRRSLAATGLDPSELVLELTEDRLLSRPDGAQLLQALRDLGVGLALDDFGTGYAGLGYLQRFPFIQVLKLDRSFVSGLGRDPVSAHIVRSVVELARCCGLRLVVEGVETPEQAYLLRGLGVRYAQGYLFGRPEPVGVPTGTPKLGAFLR